VLLITQKIQVVFSKPAAHEVLCTVVGAEPSHEDNRQRKFVTFDGAVSEICELANRDT